MKLWLMAIKLSSTASTLALTRISLRNKIGLCYNIGASKFFFWGQSTRFPLLGNYMLEKKREKKREGTLCLLDHSWSNAHVSLLHLLYGFHGIENSILFYFDFDLNLFEVELLFIYL